MADIARKTGNFPLFSVDSPSKLTIFGGSTLSTNIDSIVDTQEFTDGWDFLNGTVAPVEQDFNALGYAMSYMASYYLQKGIPEWSGTDGVIGGQEYIAGKSFVGYGGDVYVALLNSGGSVASRVPINVTYWAKTTFIFGNNTATINITSDLNITFTDEQNKYGRFVITDTGVILTTTRNVIVGTAQKRFLVQNNTAQSLVFKTSAGTGITVLACGKADLYCDGANVIEIGSVAIDINSLTDKTTPVGTDNLVIQESGGLLKKLSWANLKATLLTYFDTLYSRTTAIFGIGQTMQDVTTSRATNGIYTNSTGKLIIALVVAGNAGVFKVNGNQVAQGSNAAASTLTVPIPNGANYKMEGSFSLWNEIR